MNKSSLTKDYVAHLHCFNIEKFKEIYGEYIDKISKYMDIIVTYCFGDMLKMLKMLQKYTILKIENKGYDIGAKFIAIDYLKYTNIKYKYILFLHSKSCIKTRKIYYNSLVNNLEYILPNLVDGSIGGFFPPTIHRGDDMSIIYNDKSIDSDLISTLLYWQSEKNKLYLDELIKYFDFPIKDITLFPSGNCYILHANVANKLYGDKVLYNCLNSKKDTKNDNSSINSFDYNWIKIYYNIPYNEIEYVYAAYQKFKLKGNYLQMDKPNKIFADGMIEHAFERIIFQTIVNLNMTIDILPNNNTSKAVKNISKKINDCYQYRILYKNFDWKLYLDNNIHLEKYNINSKDSAWNYWCNYG